METSRRVYRMLMRAYPHDIREGYGEEMVGCFSDACRDEVRSRGARGLAAVWARTLPDLMFTAFKERSNMLARNAYLPLPPIVVARWGALAALVGGILGIAFHLIEYSLLGALDVVTGVNYSNDPVIRFLTLLLILFALTLSSLGLFGLYGTLVSRSGRLRRLAAAGGVFGALSAVLLVATSGYATAHELASGSALFSPFEWIWYTGTYVFDIALLFWFVGLLLLGIAAARERLLGWMRVLPLGVFLLIALSYEFGGYFEMIGGRATAVIVMGFAQSLPFVGVALLGWSLLRSQEAEPSRDRVVR